MQEANPSNQVAGPDQKKIEDERKKLDEDLEKGNITQAEYFKKVQELTGGSPAPTTGAPTPTPTAQPTTPQLPPHPVGPVQPSGPGGIKPLTPITPITPLTPQQAGPKEEIPPIGQPLAIGAEDVEVVECYKCGGLITVTTPQRPVIIACPTCGTKGEVTAEELEVAGAPGTAAVPKPTDAVELEDSKLFKFGGEGGKGPVSKPAGPHFGASLDSDLKKQEEDDKAKATPTSTPTPTATPTASPTPTQAPTPKPQTQADKEKTD